jgi:hypothetical protein
MPGYGFKMIKAETWFTRAKVDSEKDLPRNERVFGIGIVIFCVLMIIFFGFHQIQSTGFFTLNFSALEMLLFYGFWIFWITTASLEAILSQRLISRIVDTFGGLIFATISITLLLIIFPFNFSHLADILPESIRFLIQWISNDIARVIMVLIIIAHLFAAIYSPFAYKFVDKNRFKRKKTNE